MITAGTLANRIVTHLNTKRVLIAVDACLVVETLITQFFSCKKTKPVNNTIKVNINVLYKCKRNRGVELTDEVIRLGLTPFLNLNDNCMAYVCMYILNIIYK